MKYFFFDIDGTLTDNKTRKVVKSAKEAIQQLQANGHFVAIATGRAHYKSVDVANELGIHNFVSNGGCALVVDDTFVENQPLDKDKAIALCEQAETLGYGYILAVNDSIDVVMKDERFIEQVGYRKEPTRYIYQKDLDLNALEGIYKIYISIPKDKEEELTLKDTLGHIRFVDEYLCFQHDQKDQGIIRMMQYLKGDLKDVVVFGDDYNDLIMFKEEWTSIAMGNAVDALKEKASFVTKKNVEDGIQYACKYFGWID